MCGKAWCESGNIFLSIVNKISAFRRLWLDGCEVRFSLKFFCPWQSRLSRSWPELSLQGVWDGAGHQKGFGFFMSTDSFRVLPKIEAALEESLLTAILPLRVRYGHEDAIRRLDFALLDKVRLREVVFLVVDDGSAADLAERTGERSRELGFGHVRHGRAEVLVRARQEARGDDSKVGVLLMRYLERRVSPKMFLKKTEVP